MNEFTHLHLHTEFSLLDGACQIEQLINKVDQLKMSAVAVTEHGNMFSTIAFHDAARKKGIKPIIGCEVYVAPGSRFTKSGTPGQTSNHLVLLAETLEGYHNLVKLVSSGYTEGFYYKPRIDKDLLGQYSRGLIGLSSCLKGEIATDLRNKQPGRALKTAATYREILGPKNFFLEMQFQGIEEQRTVNQGLQPIARELGLPLVCTNDVHYLGQNDSQSHDILLCIGTGKNVNDKNRLRYYGNQFYLKTADEMALVFSDFPQALRCTVEISERCNVDLTPTENHLPSFKVPASYTLDEYFDHTVRNGFSERMIKIKELASSGLLKHSIDDYKTRLSYEIETIKRLKYPGYFLIVWDFIMHARQKGIPVGPGRGSAAGSLVAYCLRITDVDPLEFDLIFERFLNPERVSLPDIDIDFCERRRSEVIDYVTNRYGRENVAQIITFGTMKARAVVRDVGRALDIPYADVDRVAKQIPGTLDITLAKAREENPALKESEEKDPRIKELMEVSRRLEGIARHASVHAAGVVIAPRPLTEFVPLYKTQKGEITTQWAMKEIERVGLLKMDFLGLTTLTLLHDVVEQIERTLGEKITLTEISRDDVKTYQLFSDGHTLGVFQFESSGMRETLRKAKPKRFDDLIALNALYRPGPLRGRVIDDFIARKHGRVESKYEVPDLEPILKDTYGVIAYQEQVMRIASDLAGFSMGEADLLRKAMGKKDVSAMQAQRDRFIRGAGAKDIPKRKASKIFGLMEHFAGYGFNKSHSTSYALLAYQAAYLKANYPWYFMATLLTISAQNTEKLTMYLGECRIMNVPILPPDINTSKLEFTVTDDGVLFGLTAIKNVGDAAIASIFKIRQSSGRIRSIHELCEGGDLRLINKRVLENLVKAGVFDSLRSEPVPLSSRELRPRFLASIDRALEHGSRHQRFRERGQTELFGALETGENEGFRLPESAPWTEAQQLGHEKEALGLYLSGHPIERFSESLRNYGALTTSELARSETEVSVGGVISAYRSLRTRKGDRMAVFTLEDTEGSVEVVVFPDAYRKYESLIVADGMVLVRGRLEKDQESSRILVAEISSIASISEFENRAVSIRLTAPPHNRDTFEALLKVFRRYPGDRKVKVELELRNHDRPLMVYANLSNTLVQASDNLAKEVEELCGNESISWY